MGLSSGTVCDDALDLIFISDKSTFGATASDTDSVSFSALEPDDILSTRASDSTTGDVKLSSLDLGDTDSPLSILSTSLSLSKSDCKLLESEISDCILIGFPNSKPISPKFLSTGISTSCLSESVHSTFSTLVISSKSYSAPKYS